MRLKPEQIDQYLKQPHSDQQPVYWIAGDEFVLVDDIRKKLRSTLTTDHLEHQRYTVNAQWNPADLAMDQQNLSLFGTQRLVELDIHNEKLSAQQGQALSQYLEALDSDTMVIILSQKLDAGMQKTKWFKMLESHFILIPVWPLNPFQTIQWLKQKSLAYGLQLDQNALEYLTEYSKGHLMAAEQALQKLRDSGERHVIGNRIKAIMSDHARFDVFSWIDACRLGDAKNIVRIFEHLQQEGIPSSVLLWALIREIRLYLAIKEQHAETGTLQSFGVWSAQTSLVRTGLKRHTLKNLHAYLLLASKIDTLIKGAAIGDPKPFFLDLALALGGVVNIAT